MRKLMHQDKDREIANQLLLQATQTRLGENSLTAPLWAFPMGCSASGKNLCCSPWALHRLQLCQAAHLAWHGEICPGILEHLLFFVFPLTSAFPQLFLTPVIPLLAVPLTMQHFALP